MDLASLCCFLFTCWLAASYSAWDLKACSRSPLICTILGRGHFVAHSDTPDVPDLAEMLFYPELLKDKKVAPARTNVLVHPVLHHVGVELRRKVVHVNEGAFPVGSMTGQA